MAAPIAAAGATFPWLTAGALAGGPLLQSLFPKAFGGMKPYEGFDPEKYKGEITLDEGDLSGMRNVLMQSVKRSMVDPAVRQIKQTGAAKRLPSGATQSAISGAVSAGSRAVTQAEPGLQEQKRRSIMDFVSLKRDYLRDKNMYELSQTQQGASMMQGGVGGLSKLLMLWQGGLFDKETQPGFNVNM